MSAYHDFLAARRELLARAANDFLQGLHDGPYPAAVADTRPAAGATLSPVAPPGTARADAAEEIPGLGALLAEVNHALGTASPGARLIAGGPERVARVGIITGGAGNMIGAAHDAGLDTFITGEGAHYTYFDAIEWGLNVIFAGHYATETLGVQALASHLAERFDLDWEFHDHPTGL